MNMENGATGTSQRIRNTRSWKKKIFKFVD